MNLSRATISLLFILALSGCAYFNTFHNTKKLYKEARKERENRKSDKPGAAELKKYDETIAKASKVLELYPNSKYVDDAVLILGECFYYKQEYVRAQRKFEELITYFADSKHFGLAKLWLARTNIAMEEYFTARFILEELRDSDDIKREFREEAAILLGDIHFHQQAYEPAKEAYRAAIETIEKDELRGRASYQLGLAQLRTGEYFEAVESFRQALKNSPDKRFTFDAKLDLGRALKLSGEYKQASEICAGLLDQEEFRDKHGLVKLEIADCLYREGKALQQELMGAELNYVGKLEKAIDEYKKITLEFKRTEVSATAYYEIARIYEEDFGDFVLAKEYYDKVRTEFRNATVGDDADQKSKNISELIRLKNLVKKSQDQRLGKGPGAYEGMSELHILMLEHGVHPELRFMRDNKNRLVPEEASAAGNGTEAANGEAKVKDLDAFITSKLQLAETYLFQFGKIDSAIHEYNEVIKLFPDHIGAAQALYTNAFIYENELRDKTKTDSLLYVLIERFPDSGQAQEARKILGLLPRLDDDKVAFELYKVAEQSLFGENNPDQAIDDFERVLQTYPDSEYAPKAAYAIAWICEQILVDNDKARDLYTRIITDYPETEYANNAQLKLNAIERILKQQELEATPADTAMTSEQSLSPVVSDSLETATSGKPAITKTAAEKTDTASADDQKRNKPVP